MMVIAFCFTILEEKIPRMSSCVSGFDINFGTKIIKRIATRLGQKQKLIGTHKERDSLEQQSDMT